jgi:hypothetical protein
MEEFAVHPEAKLDGSTIDALAREANFDIVLAIPLDTVASLNEARGDAADLLVLQVELKLDGLLGKRVEAEGTSGNLFGGAQVLLHEKWRYGEDIADVVKAVTAIVGREVLISAEFDTKQVADGVRVFRAVEATGSDTTGVGGNAGIGAFKFTLHIGQEGIDARLLGAGEALWGHFAATDFVEDSLPLITIGGNRGGLGKGSNVDAAGGVALVVAGRAGFLEYGFDGGMKVSCLPVG